MDVEEVDVMVLVEVVEVVLVVGGWWMTWTEAVARAVVFWIASDPGFLINHIIKSRCRPAVVWGRKSCWDQFNIGCAVYWMLGL